MSRTFITSDPHFMHRNIAGPAVSTWKSGYRDFQDEAEMSRHIVKVWNKTVKEEDVLYCLGDWSFGGVQNIWNFRKQLRCRTIHLITGNHDDHIKNNKQLSVPASDRRLLMELGIMYDWAKDFNGFSQVLAQEMFTSVNTECFIKFGKVPIYCHHFAHRVWEGSHKGFLHFYGHSHDSIDDYGRSGDVGIDVAKRLLGDYVPFPIEYLIDRFTKKQIEFPDHHSFETNVK